MLWEVIQLLHHTRPSCPSRTRAEPSAVDIDPVTCIHIQQKLLARSPHRHGHSRLSMHQGRDHLAWYLRSKIVLNTREGGVVGKQKGRFATLTGLRTPFWLKNLGRTHYVSHSSATGEDLDPGTRIHTMPGESIQHLHSRTHRDKSHLKICIRFTWYYLWSTSLHYTADLGVSVSALCFASRHIIRQVGL